MALLRKVVVSILVVVGLAVGAGFVLPSTIHVERSIAIAAPPEQVFAEIADFNAWNTWSPWAAIDPNTQMSISGTGTNQKMVWSSEDPRVGAGTQEVVASTSPTYFKTHLEFNGQGMGDATFQLVENDDSTQVTWSFDSDMREGIPVAMKPVNTYLGFFMDSMLGPDYEAGLQNLKATLEG
ncbi:MAG: SRPBCC family protein [Cyanobacteria bacterium J06639_1]